MIHPTPSEPYNASAGVNMHLKDAEYERTAWEAVEEARSNMLVTAYSARAVVRAPQGGPTSQRRN